VRKTNREADPEYERLRLLQNSELPDLELSYYKTVSRAIPGQVKLDLQKLYESQDSANQVLLRDGDVLVVPPASQMIAVIGQVQRPGLADYKQHEPVSYYIQTAGGYSSDAQRSKVRIIKGITGQWIKPSHTVIEPGDVIFIPEKPPPTLWRVYKDVMLVVTQFATIYLIYLTATN